jgi:hypothetical protein
MVVAINSSMLWIQSSCQQTVQVKYCSQNATNGPCTERDGSVERHSTYLYTTHVDFQLLLLLLLLGTIIISIIVVQAIINYNAVNE